MTLHQNYITLLEEIDTAAKKVGRDPAAICLIAVTKSATIEQMKKAYHLGIRHFAESRLQASLVKIPLFPNDVHWHFIGPLQSNKILKVVQNFSFIHSVDSLEMAEHIAKKTQELQKNPEIFLQVNISQEKSKHGFTEEDLCNQFDPLLDLKLNLKGLMTIAPHTLDSKKIKECFCSLVTLRDSLAFKKKLPHLSMGMSQDFTEAIFQGGTHLRIGSRLFGD